MKNPTKKELSIEQRIAVRAGASLDRFNQVRHNDLFGSLLSAIAQEYGARSVECWSHSYSRAVLSGAEVVRFAKLHASECERQPNVPEHKAAFLFVLRDDADDMFDLLVIVRDRVLVVCDYVVQETEHESTRLN